MNNQGRSSHAQQRYPSIVAAGALFAFLWLSLLQHRVAAVEQLAAGVSSSIRHYFKHRQGLEAAQEHKHVLTCRA
jgi:hypothetical protein